MTSSAGFWGLSVEPDSVYNQLVEVTFRLTNIALDSKAPVSGGRISLIVKMGQNEFVLANLIPGKIEQQMVDITFCEGEDVTFSVTGDATVHLSGNYIIDRMDDEEEDMDDDDEFGSVEDDEDDEVEEEDDDDDDDDMEDIFFNENGDPVDAEGNPIDLADDDEDDEDDDDDDDDEEVMNEEDLMNLLASHKRGASSSKDAGKNQKKAKITEVTDEEADVMMKTVKNKKEGDKMKESGKKEAMKTDKEEGKKQQQQQQSQSQQQKSDKDTSKKQQVKTDKDESKKQPAQLPKKEQTTAVAAKSSPDSSPVAEKKRTLPSGLVIEDVTMGTGARANNGKKVSVRYIGKLTNGKVFDNNTGGKPFVFKLGAGAVIKGWDIGVQGMQVGGTRKLTIPSKLAYGSSGAPPDIPPNATLVFEVKLLDVK